MTLDEAIKIAEEEAEENQRVVDTGIVFNDVTIDMLYCDDTEVIEEHLANYQRCAEEHRQLAEWLKELKAYKYNETNGGLVEALMHSEAENERLHDELKVYKEQSGDAISRQAYIERYRQWGYAEVGRKIDNEALAIRVAMSLPPVTPQPKTGRWIPVEYPTGVEAFGVKEMTAVALKCSECGEEVDISDGDFKLCPYCGAKMQEVEDNG